MSKEPSDRSRRTFLAEIAGAFPILMAMPVDIPAAEKHSVRSEGRPLNVVCVGGHPDDPESGCGGTLARYADAGHKITVIYLTRGEAGIEGKSHDEAAAIRTAEAQAACKVLGATAVFAGQIDGDTRVDRKSSQVLLELVTAVEPDVVFTHWPLDTHPDHQAASLLILRAHLASRQKYPLYFFEVNSGSQTMGFAPTAYVDITATREKKMAALLAHESQDGAKIYRHHHEIMENFRGREIGVAAAEAFMQLPHDNPSGRLPGL